ncbi:hypothetical protein OG594_09185 [Streptomyces sp. NBC_01214]|uniref:hypothetical protein n=1 Tax=Streptomyces sp. NBC_01214 TaxID=2903777 RepID=UPI0022534F17|nr:hypothetical protein [Streptomyces sp. NBC_01214]MCX4801824.1 hypothetical protein [Streptomyces sp. NBC_01214]
MKKIRTDGTHTAVVDNHTDERLHNLRFVVSVGASQDTSLRISSDGGQFLRLTSSRQGVLSEYSSAKLEFLLQRVDAAKGSEVVTTTAAWTDNASDIVFDEDNPEEYSARQCDYTVDVG